MIVSTLHFLKKNQIIALIINLLFLITFYIFGFKILQEIVIENIIIGLFIVCSPLFRGKIIDKYLGETFFRSILKLVPLIMICFNNYKAMNIFFRYNLHDSLLIIYTIFGIVFIYLIYNLESKKFIHNANNLIVLKLMPNYKIQWYCAQLLLLIGGAILEEVYRCWIFFRLFKIVNYFVLGIINIMYFEIYHYFSIYRNKIIFKELILRGILSCLCLVALLIFKSVIVCIIFHVIFNSSQIKYVLNLYFIKKRGKNKIVFKL